MREEQHEKGAVDMDGEVTTGIVGADAAWARWLAGVAVSVSEGEGTYAYGEVGSGKLESTLTGVHPYARVEVNDRVQAWGLLGFGAGEMTMRPEGKDAIETDIDMRLGAVGAQGALTDAGETGGVDLVLKGDAFLVQMESARAPNTEATQADASRLRLALEGSRTFALGESAALTPGLEVGLRHDGGDAETGMVDPDTEWHGRARTGPHIAEWTRKRTGRPRPPRSKSPREVPGAGRSAAYPPPHAARCRRRGWP